MHVRMLLHEGPIEPTGFIVQAVSVVVTVLSALHLIAHSDHGHTEREQGDGQEVLHLSISQLPDTRIIGRAFNPTIPAPVIVGAVPVVFEVFFVVLAVVGDEIVECEAVVASHKVHALLSLTLLVTVDLGATQKSVCDTSYGTWFTTDKTANVVTEPAVPFLPAVSDKAADLIQASRIPRLGDDFSLRQRGIGINIPEHRRAGHQLT